MLFFPFSNLIFVPLRKPAWKDGSTATCVLAVDNILYIANLGDSRVSRMESTGGIFILPRALWGFCLFVWDVCVVMSYSIVPAKHLVLGGYRVLLYCLP